MVVDLIRYDLLVRTPCAGSFGKSFLVQRATAFPEIITFTLVFTPMRRVCGFLPGCVNSTRTK